MRKLRLRARHHFPVRPADAIDSHGRGRGRTDLHLHGQQRGRRGRSVVRAAATVTGGCAAGGTNGSNCIDVAIAINNGGTFGTAAAIDTCGANNLSGNAGNYEVPNGKCQGSGIGEIVRAFQIGTQQTTYGNGATAPAAGSVFDDGVDIANGAFNQSAAFTCNIVAAKVFQCVKGPAYSSGVLSGVGNWPSATTFISYGDLTVVSGRIGSLLGYVGGQSFPFTAGSGMSPNSTITETATCSPLASGAQEPRFDVTVAGGSIVNVVPSASTSGNPPTGLGHRRDLHRAHDWLQRRHAREHQHDPARAA